MTPQLDDLEHPLNSEEFYNLMQRYRWAGMAPRLPEDGVVAAFEAVKDYICQNFVLRAHTDGHGNDITGLVEKP